MVDVRSGEQPAARAAASSSRERIVQTARRLFIEHGYLGVSMQQIATESGLRKASLYHHFSSKDALFAAVIAEEMDRLLAEFEEADLASGPIETRLRRLAQINYRRFDQPDVHQLARDFFRFVPEPEHEEVHERLRQMESALAGAIEQAIGAGELYPVDPHHAATMFFHMMMSLAHDPMNYQGVRPPAPDDAAALVARVFVRGLRAGVECSERGAGEIE